MLLYTFPSSNAYFKNFSPSRLFSLLVSYHVNLGHVVDIRDPRVAAYWEPETIYPDWEASQMKNQKPAKAMSLFIQSVENAENSASIPIQVRKFEFIVKFWRCSVFL